MGLSPVAGATDADADAGRVVLRGAQATAPVIPESVDVDLRDLPLAKDWTPGDPIKEIPRRHTSIPTTREPRHAGGDDPLLAVQETAPLTAPDFEFAAPILNFAGQGYTGVNPADPSGDVGPNHYIQMINQSSGSRVTIYSKSGGVLAGPFTLATLGGTGNCATGLGDPVVLYDPLADRWLLSEFSSAGNRMCVYVSKTADPVSGGWWIYQFTAPSFPDYPKYGVWPDAYYVGTNETGAPAVYAFDRVKMLAGQAATSQRFTATKLAGFGFQMLTPADLDGATAPPAGSPGIFVRHRDDEAHNPPGTANDFIEVWQFSVNWTAPSASTFIGPTNIAVTQFDSALCGLTSFNCFPQPGSATTLDPLREVVMFRAQYRNRGSFQSLVGNLVTDVNGADRGGIRWFELRKTTGNWGLYMEGTYSPDTINRWMGSAAVDKDGNLAVGYSVSASTGTYPGLRYAGRLAGDPAGALSQGETTLIAGTAANASNRWGDYAQLGVDPADDCTFWFTSKYSPSSQWATRIGSFKFSSCGGAPTPDFSVSVSPSSLTIAQGANGTTTASVQSINGFSSAVSLSCSGQPAGVTCGFSPASVTPPANGSAGSTLTVSVASSTVAGTYNISVNGTSGVTRSATLTLTVTSTGGGGNAVYDPVLRAPKCATVGNSCDSGASLLLGRDTLSGGAEPNQPNTINSSCADGTSGTFHVDESNDALKVSTLDGTNFAPGKTVKIEATVWAWSTPSSDALELYYAPNANSPSWTLVATIVPTVAGAQVLSANYTLPAGNLQAVRARFRYSGTAGACGTGSYDDHDDLVFAVSGSAPPPDVTATYDSVLKAPKCSTVGKSCDTGASLVLGRDGKGPEPNQPNTINTSCADGTSGTFHSDESNDRIKVSTLDGTAFGAGKTVKIEATVWAWSTPSSDKLDLYYAANANSPVWTFITTLTPTVGGSQVLSANYTLPAGTLQAVRAQFRYGGTASACTTGSYNDRDDLIFAVQ